MNCGRKLFLHICCGPCAIMPIKRFLAEGFQVTGWFMNPNIQPLSEYLRRREAAFQCASQLGIELLADDGAWNLAAWLAEQLPRASSPNRCHWCCSSRLERTWAQARDLGFDCFSTTLLYSRYQPHDVIAACGRELEQSGPRFEYRDFRKDWQEGIDLSREWGLYRQPYCGCVFSENERYAKKLATVMKNSRLAQRESIIV